MGRHRRFLIALVPGVAALGWLDYLTGPLVAFSLFYLLPVLGAGWWLGRVPALVVGAEEALAWTLCDLGWFGLAHPWASAWNAVTRFIILVGAGLLIARVRGDQQRLQELARVDALTGLCNARAFRERLELEMARSRRGQAALCVAFLDLDNFKRVNDLHGHAAGDDLLRAVASAIRESVRDVDLPARLAGDEFVVYFYDPQPEAVESAVRRILERVQAAGALPDVQVTASAGIAVAHAPASADELIRLADAAMYRAKASGKNQLAFAGPHSLRLPLS
jgi:diguanylate cyclase (GGDEF)-like protein